MNKLWIEHSYDSAECYRECCREDFSDDCVIDLNWYEYLDCVGLFETSWMIYEYHTDRIEYGYPNNE